MCYTKVTNEFEFSNFLIQNFIFKINLEKWCTVYDGEVSEVRVQKSPEKHSPPSAFIYHVAFNNISPIFCCWPLFICPENLWFSDVCRGYKKRSVAWNGLKHLTNTSDFFINSLLTQIKWVDSIWNASLSWNGLFRMCLGSCFQRSITWMG